MVPTATLQPDANGSVAPVPGLLPRDPARHPRRGDVLTSRTGLRRVVVTVTDKDVVYVTISKRAPKSQVSRAAWAAWCRKMNAVSQQGVPHAEGR